MGQNKIGEGNVAARVSTLGSQVESSSTAVMTVRGDEKQRLRLSRKQHPMRLSVMHPTAHFEDDRQRSHGILLTALLYEFGTGGT